MIVFLTRSGIVAKYNMITTETQLHHARTPGTAVLQRDAIANPEESVGERY